MILLRLRDLCLDSLFDLIVIGTKYLRLSSDMLGVLFSL